jgi:Zn-dependent metalloprotease
MSVPAVSLCLLLSLWRAPLPAAGPQDGPAARERLLARVPELGLDAGTDFRVLDVEAVPAGTRHVRLQQLYRGLRVWGGQAITHRDGRGRETPMTDALVRDIRLDAMPSLERSEALAIAWAREAPGGTFTRPPRAELVVLAPGVLVPAPRVRGMAGPCRLVYHVHLELRPAAGGIRHDDCFVDAGTGAVLKTWSSLMTAALAKGTPVNTTGASEYSGTVQLGSLQQDGGFLLFDPTRGNISTRDLGGAAGGDGRLYANPLPAWGDGRNYDAGQGTGSANGQTAAVDAHYGLMTTWDFYRNILGRDGIDGKGRPAANLVHYDHGYDNAFWSDDCFCMTYGDGSTFRTLTAMDVVGHEVSHGLCHATADLMYWGESGGLNEANSDIFGVMINFYAKGAMGKGSRIPDDKGAWTIGADLATTQAPGPLRYLYKPSLDGASKDAWGWFLWWQDVHHSSGPMNRAFYFLSQGASADPKDDTYSEYLPKGMAGIGNDKALRIWWQTLATELTPCSGYWAARRGAIRSAQELYGEDGAEVAAVRSAFDAVNVGGWWAENALNVQGDDPTMVGPATSAVP